MELDYHPVKNFASTHSPTIFSLCRLGRQRIRHETCDKICSYSVTILSKQNVEKLLMYMYIYTIDQDIFAGKIFRL